MKKITLMLAAALVLIGAQAQLNTPSPSPLQTIKQNFGLSFIELSYSRPGMKNRKVFGDLVPFGQVWRTGANAATTLTFGDEVIIGGTKIPAGKYGLLSIPGEKEWNFIISKQTDVTSPDDYKQDQDVVRIKATPASLPGSVETMTITFENIKGNSCNIGLSWESTYVSFAVSTDVDSKVMKQIDNIMNKDNRPYYQAASYYYDNGKDLNQALTWVNKATEAAPNTMPWVHTLKTRILAKMGRKDEAMAAAKNAIRIATETKYTEFAKQNEEIMKTLK